MSLVGKVAARVAPLEPKHVASSLLADFGVAPTGRERAAEIGPKRPVQHTPDLARILALPRRLAPALQGPEGEALADLMTERLSRRRSSPCRCKALGRPGCITRLKPAQGWALYEAPLAGGLVGNIGVGAGKTGLDILMPMAMPDCKIAVLFVPPNLVPQLQADYLAWAEHWRVPSIVGPGFRYLVAGAPVLHVVPYSRLSRAEATDLLDSIGPDLLIADECHRLKNADTATTSRFLRAMIQANRRLCAWSGTVTKDSIKNYWHLMAFALKDSSPTPLDKEAMKEWATALDAVSWPAPPGALLKLCEPGEHVQAGYRRRLTQTRGVVTTVEGALGAAIYLHRRDVQLPDDRLELDVPRSCYERWSGTLGELIERVRQTGTRPDGEELVEATEVAACCKQLASGFYYRWKFPKGEPDELIDEWFRVRKEWHKELREILKERRPHLDSPLLCAKAAIRHAAGYTGDLPTWDACWWPEWREIRNRVYHETEAIWLSDYLARDASAWAEKHRGVIWYEYGALGQKIAEVSGLRLYGAGPEAKAALTGADGKKSVICSIKAHGTGHDGLQYLYNEQLFANVPSSGQTFEQALGRLHRVGQPEDEVHATMPLHTDEYRDALTRATNEAAYVRETIGSSQKLLDATRTWVK